MYLQANAHAEITFARKLILRGYRPVDIYGEYEISNSNDFKRTVIEKKILIVRHNFFLISFHSGDIVAVKPYLFLLETCCAQTPVTLEHADKDLWIAACNDAL